MDLRSCPNISCTYSYDRRRKPDLCPLCRAMIGDDRNIFIPVPNKDIYQIFVNNCFKIWFEWNFCFWWLKRSTVIITIKHHVASNSWNTINPLIAIVNLNWAFQNDKMINFKMLFVGGSYVAVLSPSPKPSPKRTMTPKVFKLMTDVFSVFHHKHFRVICQMGPGKISIASHQNYLFFNTICRKVIKLFVFILQRRKRTKWEGPDCICMSPSWHHFRYIFLWPWEANSLWDVKVCTIPSDLK